MLDTPRDAPAEYHDKLTVAKTFALAIDEAAKLHPAAEPLIVHAALLAPEPIPLFLFAEAQENFGEPLASALADSCGGPAPVVTGEYRLGDVRHITASSERIRRELGWQASVLFTEGVAEFASAPAGRRRSSV